MFFSPDQVEHLNYECDKLLQRLKEFQAKIVKEDRLLDSAPLLREQLIHGAGRRVGVIKRSIENIFLLFPPDTIRVLESDVLADVQINLHAFMINIYGIYDNWAWAYALRHNLEAEMGGRQKIGSRSVCPFL
jgi:hypothetical protein